MNEYIVLSMSRLKRD